MELIWILVNCATTEEAQHIGGIVLHERLCACYDIFNRTKTAYFWPPLSGAVESGTGALLVLETDAQKFALVSGRVKELHSDQLPFIGSIAINNISPEYLEWVRGELELNKK